MLQSKVATAAKSVNAGSMEFVGSPDFSAISHAIGQLQLRTSEPAGYSFALAD